MSSSLMQVSRLLLLCALSTLFHLKTHAKPIDIDDPKIDAILPSCVTLTSGSTSCNIGINPVPTLDPSLDGGYQWISIEPTTIVNSGTVIATDEGVWTKSETNYVSIIPVTTTIGGSIVTSTSTGYFDFITETAVAEAGGGAVIAAVVIAPAVIPSLQNVADKIVASTATTSGVASEIIQQLGKAGFAISESEATTMGAILIAMATAGTAVEFYKLHKLGPWIQDLSVKPPMMAPTPTPSFQTTSSSVTTVTLSAIEFLPYSIPIWTDLTQGLGIPLGPTPTDDSLDIATTTSLECTKFTGGLFEILGNFCVCASSIVGFESAASGTSTISICNITDPAFSQTFPTGFTIIPPNTGIPLSSMTVLASTTSASSPSSTISSSSVPPATTSPPPNPSSSACKNCGTDLGSSSCGPGDSTCLIDQCNNDTNCQECGIPCSIYAQPYSAPSSSTQSSSCNQNCGAPFCC